MKPSELLDKPEKWTKGSFAFDLNHQSMSFNEVVEKSKQCVCWCLAGAIRACSSSYKDYSEKRDQLERVLTSNSNEDLILIIDWNDAPERTYEEVITFLKENDL